MYSVGSIQFGTTGCINLLQEDKSFTQISVLEYFLTRVIEIYNKIQLNQIEFDNLDLSWISGFKNQISLKQQFSQYSNIQDDYEFNRILIIAEKCYSLDLITILSKMKFNKIKKFIDIIYTNNEQTPVCDLDGKLVFKDKFQILQTNKGCF